MDGIRHMADRCCEWPSVTPYSNLDIWSPIHYTKDTVIMHSDIVLLDYISAHCSRVACAVRTAHTLPLLPYKFETNKQKKSTDCRIISASSVWSTALEEQNIRMMNPPTIFEILIYYNIAFHRILLSRNIIMFSSEVHFFRFFVFV